MEADSFTAPGHSSRNEAIPRCSRYNRPMIDIPTTAAAGSVERRVIALMGACERAVGEGRESDALRFLKDGQVLLPEHPLVLQELGRRALAAGEPRAARNLLEQAVAAEPRHGPLWLQLAATLRVLALHDAELEALDRALTIDPKHPIALLRKAALLDLMGKRRNATRVYGNALAVVGTNSRLPPGMETLVQEARRRVEQGAAELDAYISERVVELRAAHPVADRHRFERCIDLLLGRARLHEPQPTFMRFPHLRDYEFYERSEFPWLEALEARTAEIREECLAVLAGDEEGLEPYVAYRDGLPLNQWRELNNSRRWSAYFLWKNGVRIDGHADRCPRTIAALAATPQVDIPAFGPTGFFSILDAKTHIPPHHGATNTRLTVHVPLVVPPGCTFRVGGDTRPWRAGEAWVFDDTIEHEARNDSDAPRAILLFDVWNPELSAAERDLVRAATHALGEFFDAEGLPDIGL